MNVDNKPKMATNIPPEITTPDSVETRLGTKEGVPVIMFPA
jgi:hypothetical protein